MSVSGVCSVMATAASVRLFSCLAWWFALSLNLIWYFLLVSKKVRVVWLYLLPLSRPSSCCSWIKANLNSLSRAWTHWGRGTRLTHWLLAFDMTWWNHLLLLLILCWISSASMLGIVLFLLLLQYDLLFFQNLNLISIFHTCWSFAYLGRICHIVEFLHSFIFFIPTEVKLLCLVHIAFCCHRMINHLNLIGVIVSCSSTLLLSSIALILLNL